LARPNTEAPIQGQQFADSDAQLVAQFLRTPRGGGISDENLVLLTNQQTTRVAVTRELEKVLTRGSARDTVILYIAATSAVESKRDFIVTYDSAVQNLVYRTAFH
jgi:hypothetical protein